MVETLAVDTLKRILEAFNRHDLDAIMKHFAEDSVMTYHEVPIPGEGGMWASHRYGKDWRDDSPASPTCIMARTNIGSVVTKVFRSGP